VSTTPELGTIVGGKYRLVRSLGHGGMGTVYEAENTLTLKRAAIKWLHPQFASDDGGRRRCIYEARACARIRHENVVDVYDVLEEGDSIFLVMELLLGEPLSARLVREPLSVHELVGLLLPVMRGTAAAHAVGVVHRDIKPDNIFLAQKPGHLGPVPMLIDFGISKLVDAESTNLTRSGVTMGTPRYVSYEQLMGARDVDARTDVYAFGVVLYEGLGGRSAYPEARSFGEQAVAFATQRPLPLRALRPELPEALAAIVDTAIAKERTERTASLDVLIRALEPFAEQATYKSPLRAFSGPQAASSGPAGETHPAAPDSGARPLPRAHDEQANSGVAPRALRGSLPVAARRGRLTVLALAVSSVAALVVFLGFPSAQPTARPLHLPGAATGPSKLAAPSGPPALQVEAAPHDSESVADASAPVQTSPAAAPPLAGTPRARRAGKRSALGAAVTADAGAALAEPAAAPAASAAPSQDDGMHRAGRVNRREF